MKGALVDLKKLRLMMALLVIGTAYSATVWLMPRAAGMKTRVLTQGSTAGGILEALDIWQDADASEYGVTASGQQEDDSKSGLADKRTIVLDAGHGGYDSGKVSVTGALEKDLNLLIVLELKEYLEKIGFGVVLTRNSDVGLYSDGDKNRKRADLKKRCDIIDSSGASVAVSIHLNSFTDENVSGAQVFYYKGSTGGEKLASSIQQAFGDILPRDNTRVEKSNDTYYLLLNTKIPVVIAECGFLSNEEEAGLLESAEYRTKLVEALGTGIVRYYSLMGDMNVDG